MAKPYNHIATYKNNVDIVNGIRKYLPEHDSLRVYDETGEIVLDGVTSEEFKILKVENEYQLVRYDVPITHKKIASRIEGIYERGEAEEFTAEQVFAALRTLHGDIIKDIE